LHPGSLVTFSNFSGARGGDVWPETSSLPLLFALSFLLPAYTITGFDASANTAEETVGAAVRVPRGIVSAVAVSGLSGWVMLGAAMATVYTPVYEIMAAVTAIFLYISYVLPTALGLRAYGRRWTAMGPWHLGRWYRPLAAVSVLGCVALILIGMQPPNEKTAW